MIRCAIYARYSDDRQNERSIEDQIVVCTRRALERGWSIVAAYSDAAMKGWAMANRPGLQDAIAGAESGVFDVLLAEDEDRIARNLEHQAHIFNRFKAARVDIATLATASITITDVALRGLMAELFVQNLSAKTQRGMHSNAEKGLATGSRTYGYRSQPGGEMTIVPEERDIIRRVYDEYVRGVPPRQIAADLNSDGIPGPRGGLWSHSSINGSRQRGNGILHCELYGGVKVWNRFDMRRNTATGGRTSHAIPPEQWKRVDVPHLAIIDPDTWAKARAKLAVVGQFLPHQITRKPAWLFSGLVKCRCGASYTVYTTGKLICAAYREKGQSVCDNRRTPNRDEIQRRVLDGIRTKLLSPEAVAAAVRKYHQAAQERRARSVDERAPIERRLSELKRGISRLVDAIVAGTSNEAMQDRMTAMDAERIGLEARLAGLDTDPPLPTVLHPRAAAGYALMVEKLQAVLASATAGETAAQRELVDAVRGIIEKIEIIPRSQERGAPIDLVLHGKLALFLETAEPGPKNIRLGALVAGGRYQRTQPTVPIKVRMRLRA